MNKLNKSINRGGRILLALMLCLVMMPVSAFAEEVTAPAENGETITVETGSGNEDPGDGVGTGDTGSGETAEPVDPADPGNTQPGDNGATDVVTPEPEPEPQPEEPVEPETVKTERSFTWGGNKLSFSKDIITEDPLDSAAAPSRVWIKAGKKNIKVSWKSAADQSLVDGYFVLRRKGSAKTYTQVARLDSSKTSYTDSKASKKNTAYRYIVVGYKKQDDAYRISPCSPWAAGLTTKSRLKNGYTANISKTKASLQSGGTIKLTAKYSKPKKIYSSGSFRWYSDNSEVASVSSTGTVTAKTPGETTIRVRLASGSEVTCKVTVVGAFKPGTPALEVECATPESIELSWNKTSHAKVYELYCDSGDGTYNLIAETSTAGYTHTGLTEGTEYKYYVTARNDNNGYTAYSDPSQTVTQQAVRTPRKTRVSGFPASASPKAASTYSFEITVRNPDGAHRKASLELSEDGEWVSKKIIDLPEGTGDAKVKITVPDTWWRKTGESWRLVIPASEDSAACTSQTLKITTARRYQNPSKYVQITNTISKHGYDYYTAPVLVDNMSTKQDHIEAMIKTAYKYKGDRYANRWSRAPGQGVDCSGLVMQACYGAGVDLWPSNPHRHRYGAARYEWESREIAKHTNLKTVSYKNRKRGDLIFFCNSRGTIIHVAIYLGNNKIIHSTTVGGHVVVTGMGNGAYGRVCKVKRIFN